MTYLFVMNEKDSAFRQKQIDRKFGYFIIAVIFLIGLSALGLGFFHLKNPDKLRTISFDKVGNLKLDDPVYLFGILVGKIKNIELCERNVLVHVRLEKPLQLHQGYHIDNIDIGIMGDRMLSVDFGDTTTSLVPEQDTLIGTFLPGVSEGVGLAWKLKSVIDSFVELSAKLLKNSPMRASFVQRVNEIANATDTASMTLVHVITRLGNGLSGQLDTLNRVINGVALFSIQADSLTAQSVSALEKQIGLIGNALTSLESMIDGLIVATGKLESLENPDEHGAIAAFMIKIKVLRDAVLHVKEGLSKLAKLSIKPT